MGVGGDWRTCTILQVTAFPATCLIASTRYLRLPKGLVGFWKGYYIYKKCRRFVFLEFLVLINILYWRLIIKWIWLLRSFISLVLCVYTSPRTKTLLKQDTCNILILRFLLLYYLFDFFYCRQQLLLLCGQDVLENKELNSKVWSLYSIILLFLSFKSFNLFISLNNNFSSVENYIYFYT